MTKIKNENSIIRHFSPAWFAASMGTGGLANLMYQTGAKIAFLKPIGITLWIINIIMFICFLIPWVLRWFLHKDRLNMDLKHPIMSNFFITMPVAAIILASNFLLMGQSLFQMNQLMTFAIVIWFIGAFMSIILAVYTMYNMMSSENMTPETANFAWFITPVASIVIPLLGNSLIGYYANINIELAKFVNIMDLSFFGIGFILFILISAILLNRFIFNKMPPAMVLPTFWIILGPIGVSTIVLFGLADANTALGYITDPGIFKILGVIIWGFGFWAFGLVASISIKYIKNGKIPFSLSWWAFIFPLSAYLLSGLAVYKYTNSQFVHIYTIVLLVLLSVLWILTFVKSLIGIINKKLLIPTK